ncbi:hypothetical protein T484DRAFT_1928785 [Baffinella frigidus]|nr:hypothetical protein T484DRAFT_1928785 [Cryptophyta sp. CCMP2293]
MITVTASLLVSMTRMAASSVSSRVSICSSSKRYASSCSFASRSSSCSTPRCSRFSSCSASISPVTASLMLSASTFASLIDIPSPATTNDPSPRPADSFTSEPAAWEPLLPPSRGCWKWEESGLTVRFTRLAASSVLLATFATPSPSPAAARVAVSVTFEVRLCKPPISRDMLPRPPRRSSALPEQLPC